MADDADVLQPDPAPRHQQASRADRRRDDEYENDDDDRDARHRPRGRGVKYDEDGNEITSKDTLLALFSHLGLIVIGFLAPLILFLVCREKSPFIARHAKAALNYALTHLMVVFGWFAVAALIGLTVYLVGQNGMAGFFTGYILAIIGSVAVGIATIVFAIMGTVAAAGGKPYRYPICVTFIS